MITLTQKKRKASRKPAPTISNTGFIGSVFLDTLELQQNRYYFSRKKLHIAHRLLDRLAHAISSLFTEHHVPAYLACVYVPHEQKIGFVLSTKPFEKTEGIAYFTNYLIEKNMLINKLDVLQQEIFNTGFIGVVFADLSHVERFTFEFERNLLSKLITDMIIPVKELFLRNNIPAYISGVEITEQHKLGWVLSVKPYDEKLEAILYFEAYLKELGFYVDDETELDKIVIRKKVESVYA